MCCVFFVVDCHMLCVDRFTCLRSLFVACCVSLLVCCLMFVGVGVCLLLFVDCVCHVL